MPDSSPTNAQERATELALLVMSVGHQVANAFYAALSRFEVLSIEAGTGPRPDRGPFADVMTAVETASSLSHQFTMFARKSIPWHAELIDLAQLVDAVLADEKALADSGVQWTIALSASTRVEGDRALLERMMRAILKNARESLAAGSGTIDVRLDQDDSGRIVLEISNTGPIVAPETAARAPEPFYSTKPGHRGLGLTLANAIGRAHDFSLSFTARADGGALVRLRRQSPVANLPASKPRDIQTDESEAH